ncbi:MAG: hypothetical protein NVS3B20_13670 [Polyangiales bacterium]
MSLGSADAIQRRSFDAYPLPYNMSSSFSQVDPGSPASKPGAPNGHVAKARIRRLS